MMIACFCLYFIPLVDFASVEPSLWVWDESHLDAVCDLFLCYWIQLIFCWEILHLYSSKILTYNFLFFFSMMSLSGFVIRVMMVSQSVFGSVASSPFFLEEVGKDWACLVAQLVKNLPAVWETRVPSLGWEDALGKGKATHSSVLA